MASLSREQLQGRLADAEITLGRRSIQMDKLERENEQLREEAARRRDWIWRMKSRLGYDQNVSFDRVMEDLIARQSKEEG